MGGPGPITMHEVKRTRGWPLPLRVEHLPNGRYVVVDRDGVRRSGIMNHADLAEATADRLEQAAEARIIACLCCGLETVSEGAHNRLCPACRSGRTDDKHSHDERARSMGYADVLPPVRVTLPILPWGA